MTDNLNTLPTGDVGALVEAYKDALLNSDHDEYTFSIKRANLRTLIATILALAAEVERSGEVMARLTEASGKMLTDFIARGNELDAKDDAIEAARDQGWREGVEAAAGVADQHARDAWEIGDREGQNAACSSGRNYGARFIADTIRQLERPTDAAE